VSVRTIANREWVRRQAIALRLEGAPYRTIGRRLGIAAMTALAMYQAEIDEDGPHADRLRRLELGRVDEQLATLTQRRAELVGAHIPEGSE